MLNSGENHAKSLFFAANVYKSHNWSVIPLIGNADSSRSKHPAIKWGRYQHTHPTDDDLQHWFVERRYEGLGIVLGAVSRLVVLDFDDPNEASEFRRLMPNLTHTRMVESGTRALPHYYYALPDNLRVYSRHVPGIDLRADGTYVVAPPTCVGDKAWRLVQDEELHVLDRDDLSAILRFMAKPAPSRPQISLKPPSRTIKGYRDGGSGRLISGVHDEMLERRNSDASFDLVSFYRSLLAGGRNNALFEVAMLARDRGYSEAAVRASLVNVHGLQSDINGQREPFLVRYAEAVHTIASVFSRPVRCSTQDENSRSVGIPTPHQSRGLPIAVREWLLQHGLVAAARVLDGLYMSGLQAGAYFTERIACSLLSAYQIGRRSIMTALKTILPNGLRLFQPPEYPPVTPRTEANAAAQIENGKTKCDLVTGANRVKIPGRPATYYILPDAITLAQHAGVGIPTLQAVNDLQPDDLSSPAAYRRGLHRGLVTRRPGQYTRNWLASRLGISRWTCRRYESRLGMVIHPMYSEQPVTWKNLATLLPASIDDSQPGTFLEVAGKRYPPLQCIAARLLEKRVPVLFKHRMANYYTMLPGSVGIPTPQPELHTFPRGEASCSQASIVNDKPNDPSKYQQPINHVSSSPGVGIPTPQLTPPQSGLLEFWLCPGCLKTAIQESPPDQCSRCSGQQWEHVPRIIWQDQERLKFWWQSRWREKYPSAPRQATPLITRTKRRNSDASATTQADIHSPTCEHLRRQIPGLSLKNAAALVDRYGSAMVERCLRVIAHRSYIRNPAGFLTALLKSESLFYEHIEPQPKTIEPPESAATWVQEMRQSPYRHFLANADEFVRV